MNYVLKPMVPGEIGPNAEFDNSTWPPTVRHPDIMLDSWPQDDLLAAFPLFMVTERLKAQIEQSGLSGPSFSNMTVHANPQYGGPVPSLFVMQVSTAPADFCLAGTRLSVSEAALQLLRRFVIDECEVVVSSE